MSKHDAELFRDSEGRPFPLGKRYKYPSDYKPDPQGMIHKIMGIKELESYRFKFHYQFSPSDNVYIWQVDTYSKERAELDFGKFLRGKSTLFLSEDGKWQIQRLEKNNQGKPFKVARVEKIPIGKRSYFCYVSRSKKTDKRKKEAQFIHVDQAELKTKNLALRKYIKNTAQKLAKSQIDLQDDLEQEAWIRVCSKTTIDLEVLKAEALTAMQSAEKADQRWHQRH